MNTEQLKGRWHQMKGDILKQWGKLTNDDLDIINGEHERLIGKIMARHRITRAEAEQQVHEFGNINL